MKPFDFSKHSSALKQRLRDVLGKHETAYAFKMNKVYSQTLQSTLEALRIQEEQFADFVIRKQEEIDAMETGIIKSKMQEHLDKIAVRTYEHFGKLTDKYQWMLKGDNDEGTKLNYSQN
jgi:hypothetical protein